MKFRRMLNAKMIVNGYKLHENQQLWHLKSAYSDEKVIKVQLLSFQHGGRWLPCTLATAQALLLPLEVQRKRDNCGDGWKLEALQ